MKQAIIRKRFPFSEQNAAEAADVEAYVLRSIESGKAPAPEVRTRESGAVWGITMSQSETEIDVRIEYTGEPTLPPIIK